MGILQIRKKKYCRVFKRWWTFSLYAAVQSDRSTNRFHVDLPFTCHDQKWLFDPLWQAAICLNHPMVMLLLLIAPDLHCHLHILGFRLGEMHQSCCKRLSTVTLCPVATSEINSLHRSVHTSASLELSGKEGLCV